MRILKSLGITCLLFVGLGSGCALAQTLYGCAHKTTGAVRLVAGPGLCHTTEYEITWADASGMRTKITELEARVSALETAIGVINKAPEVEAGKDQTALVTHTVFLAGTATDDGLGLHPLSTNWTKSSGPDAVTFSNASAQATNVNFDQPGTYLLTLTASDGILSVSDDVTVTVLPYNIPPTVNPGNGITLNCVPLGTIYGCSADLSVRLSGTASDDGLPGPLVTEWIAPEMRGVQISFNASQLTTSVSVQVDPFYTGRFQTLSLPFYLRASDGYFTVTSGPVNVLLVLTQGQR